jgi:hypothetical protein
MFCEDEVLEAAACAVVLHEIGRNKEKKEETTKNTSYKNTDKSAPPNHRPQSLWKIYHTVL